MFNFPNFYYRATSSIKDTNERGLAKLSTLDPEPAFNVSVVTRVSFCSDNLYVSCNGTSSLHSIAQRTTKMFEVLCMHWHREISMMKKQESTHCMKVRKVKRTNFTDGFFLTLCLAAKQAFLVMSLIGFLQSKQKNYTQTQTWWIELSLKTTTVRTIVLHATSYKRKLNAPKTLGSYRNMS